MTLALKEPKQRKEPNIKNIEKVQCTLVQIAGWCISSCVTNGTKPKPRPYLTAAEDKSLITIMQQSWGMEKERRR